jgi:hypothetical protein
MRRHLALALGLSLALVAAACSDGDQTTETGDAPSSTTTAPSSTDPGDEGGEQTGDAGVVVTYDVHGGFVPVEVNVGNTADIVVLQDGRVLSPAPTIAIYPGPALPVFQVSQADPAAVQALVDAIEALDPDADYSDGAQQVIADAPDTTVTLHRGDETVSFTAYALGMTDDVGGDARQELADVVQQLNGLATGTGEQPFEPTALRVHDITELAGPMAAGGEGEPSGRVLDWPLPHEAGDCSVVDDPAQVSAALEVLRQATQLDRYRTAAGERALVVVPLLPGDPGCPDS